MYVQVRSPETVERTAARVQELAGEPAPSGRAVPCGHADGDSERGEEHLADPVAGAGSGIGDYAGDFGDRHHEHHAGDRDERTREIGVRLAVGASAKMILLQFLAEAMMMSLSGGPWDRGGVAIPLSVGLFADIRIPISPVAIVVAFGVSCLVGLVFGILPANRAAR